VSGPDTEKIGSRVSMLIQDSDGGRRELLGRLLSETVLVKKDGTEITFNPSQVLSWKVVPEQPERRPMSTRIREIEQASSATFPAVEVAQLGGWELRASGGFTNRANSVLPHGAPPFGEPNGDLAQAIDVVIDFYRSRELVPNFQVPLPSYAALDSALEELGWESTLEVSVQICQLEQLIKESEHSVEISVDPDQEWLSVFDRPLGQDGLAVLTGGGGFFAKIRQVDPVTGNQVVAAIGRCAVFEKWCGFTAINTVSQFQRRGLAKSIIQSLAGRARSMGAEQAFLQVSANNVPAITLYQKLGFTQHHTYKYRSLT